MPLQKIQFKPGLNRESTNYTTEGKYWDCDKVRFRSGFPEKIGGWVRAFTTQLRGVVRLFYNWQTLSGIDYLGIGTTKKLYVEAGQIVSDITPIRRTAALTNPLTTVNLSTTYTFTDVGHGAIIGDTVSFAGFTGTLNGVPAASLNTSFVVVSVVDADNYTVVGASAANANGTPAAAGITATYEINVGLDYATSSIGYGTGVYGRGGYGSALILSSVTPIRLWSMSTYGEDLIACISNGPIYYWQSSLGTSSRAIPLQNTSGAADVPTVAILVDVTDARHTIAYGCNPAGSSVQDKLLIRWSIEENPSFWTNTALNTAGEYRLSVGSSIVAREHTKLEVLIWTDAALYSQKFTGPPYTFSHDLIAGALSIASQNAAITVNNTTYWMGVNKFYQYNGQVSTLVCDVRSYVFADFNMTQSQQVFAGANEQFNEVWWFYCSASAVFPDKYVVYNYVENVWTFGSLQRSAWIDSTTRGFPIGAGANYVVYHEYGLDDGEMGSVTPINAYIESANFDVDDGNSLMYIKRILPDLSFTGSTAANPSTSLTFGVRDFPGENYRNTSVIPVTRSTTVPFELYTKEQWIKLRGRQAYMKLGSTALGVQWQLGAVRIDVQQDGRK